MLFGYSTSLVFYHPACHLYALRLIHRTIVLLVGLYKCEVWFLMLRKEQRHKAFEKKVLTKTCEVERKEVKGGWRNLFMSFVIFTPFRK